jgi:hypothetical protein
MRRKKGKFLLFSIIIEREFHLQVPRFKYLEKPRCLICWKFNVILLGNNKKKCYAMRILVEKKKKKKDLRGDWTMSIDNAPKK